MFRPKTFDPITSSSSYEDISQYDNDKELSLYADENDTTNLEKLYHYETSEDHEDESTGQYQQNCCPEINRDLIVYKLFYFIFFGAVGALFPYLAVFYKQLWLSPHQVGILIGLRPFIQMCASPLWGVLADTYNVSKWILLMSIGAWLASNYSIALVKPEKYEPGCNLNLTYLPLTGDVDEQDISWVRIEPIMSKKYNISRPGSAYSGDISKQENAGSTTGQQGLGNEDYTSNGDIDRGYDEDKLFRYDDGDELSFNIEESSPARNGEKNLPVLLYTAHERSKSETSKIMTEERKNKTTTEIKRNKVINEATNKKYMKNVTVMKILEKMFKSRELRKGSKNKEKVADVVRNARQLHTEPIKNLSLKIKPERIKKSKTNWILWYKRLLTKGPAFRTGLQKSKKVGVKVLKRNIERSAREDEGITDQDSQQEDSDEYLEDVLNDSRKGELYAESILPNQRVLAKEGLKEEFDSLKSTEGMFWPIVNKADPTNSSEHGRLQQGSETTKIFNILLAITICGTVLSSPAATLSDTATLQVLGKIFFSFCMK